MDVKQTQTEMVLAYIEEFGSITTMDAFLELGITRLSAKVFNLRKLGFPIVGEIEGVKNRHGKTVYIKRYRLEGDTE